MKIPQWAHNYALENITSGVRYTLACREVGSWPKTNLRWWLHRQPAIGGGRYAATGDYYRKDGSWGPPEADRLTAEYGGWHSPWVAS